MDSIILDIPSIPGQSQITNYVGKIELLSYSHGIAQQITGDQSNTERTSGKPNHQDLTVSKYVDIATCPTVAACNAATNLGTLTLSMGRNDQGVFLAYLVIKMENVLVSSVSISGGSSDKPTETVTFNYSKITWTFTGQNTASGQKGSNSAVWNLATNTAS